MKKFNLRLLPHLKSVRGVLMLRKYVRNWVSVLVVYSGIKHSTVVIFRNGETSFVSNSIHLEFYEKLYSLHCMSKGISYDLREGSPIVNLQGGIRAENADNRLFACYRRDFLGQNL